MTGCSEKPRTENKNEKIDANMIKIVKQKKVFFGHQSVGYNILSGIESLTTEINLHELDKIENIDTPGIYHAKIGKNGFPKSKVDAFIQKLRENDFGNKIDVAFLKFCYVDFNKDSDIHDIINYYIKSIKLMSHEFPKLRIIHVTVPLTVHSYGIRNYIRTLIFGDISNVKRNQYNSLLINIYKDSAAIYDLAALESRYPDGTRESF